MAGNCRAFGPSPVRYHSQASRHSQVHRLGQCTRCAPGVGLHPRAARGDLWASHPEEQPAGSLEQSCQRPQVHQPVHPDGRRAVLPQSSDAPDLVQQHLRTFQGLGRTEGVQAAGAAGEVPSGRHGRHQRPRPAPRSKAAVLWPEPRRAALDPARRGCTRAAGFGWSRSRPGRRRSGRGGCRRRSGSARSSPVPARAARAGTAQCRQNTRDGCSTSS